MLNQKTTKAQGIGLRFYPLFFCALDTSSRSSFVPPSPRARPPTQSQPAMILPNSVWGSPYTPRGQFSEQPCVPPAAVRTCLSGVPHTPTCMGFPIHNRGQFSEQRCAVCYRLPSVTCVVLWLSMYATAYHVWGSPYHHTVSCFTCSVSNDKTDRTIKTLHTLH